jgi:hypothetical protein
MQRGAPRRKSNEDAVAAYKLLDTGNQQSGTKESRKKRLGPLKTAASSLAARLHMTDARKRTPSRHSGKVNPLHMFKIP